MTKPIEITSTGYQPTAPRPAAASPAAQTGDFAGALERAAGGSELRFSNHARKRMEKRELNLGDDGLQRLAQAVEKADRRGGRESLVLMDDMAFIVNVRERLVVTALDASKRGEGVFTQIDSVVLAEPGSQVEQEA